MHCRIAIGVFIVAMLAGPGLADLTNGSFESGLTGWTTDVSSGGSATTVTSHSNSGGTGTTSWSPTAGQYFARLLGNSPTVATKLSQSLTVAAGDVLSFDYFWDWTDYPSYWDPARGTIISDTGAQTLLFEESGAKGYSSYWGTPWTQVTHTFADAGTYTLLFEVRNSGDFANSPYLGIDDVALNGINVVPVPAAMLLGMLGLGTAGIKLRRLI